MSGKFRLFIFSQFLGVNIFSLNAFGQVVTFDTVNVAYGKIIVLNDTVIIPQSDTIVIFPSDLEYKIKDNPHNKSQAFYDSLEVKASKNMIKGEIYRNLVKKQAKAKVQTGEMIKPQDKYLPFEGMIINNIEFYKVDILDGNVNDTSIKAQYGIAKFLNASHKKTIDKVLMKNLLINEGEPINPVILADNERLLRALSYIEDAVFIVMPIDSTKADLVVVTKDVFPIGIGLGYSNYKKFNIQLSHNNVLGTGQGLKYRALVDANYSPLVGTQLEYSKSNIGNSFATVNIKYKDIVGYTNINGKLNSGFLTPETKYGYGIEADQIEDSIRLEYPDTSLRFGFKRNSTGVWMGRSFQLSTSQRQNLVSTLKFNRTNYEARPLTTTDSNQYFQNSQSMLGALTYIKSRHFTTRYLRGFGRTEDVLTGFLVSGTFGYFWTDLNNVLYGGALLGYGHVFDNSAYWAFKLEYGSYYKEKPIQGVASLKLRGYTKLIKINRSNLRLLAELRYSAGINRYKYEWVKIDDDIKGMSSSIETRGKSKTAFGFEAILFTGSYFYGFQFAPYLFGVVGLIRDKDPLPYEGNVYDGIGLGVRIRNESLVFQTFDLSFIVYPQRPDGGKSFSIIFDDREPKVFEGIKIGEPEVVEY